eukprot:gnl/Hemi2/2600_TR926_c0_g1_i1.p1 gnl/Hemi2/2600_TR926_c0_g1~~gnl/Hemi2/2600_TR926_c0_g1_i1.p1  ORF type:complete len:247 (-),score=91.87 gnl/Hemi2/2600_TR926_c0_g1_i1:198-938(-)
MTAVLSNNSSSVGGGSGGISTTSGDLLFASLIEEVNAARTQFESWAVTQNAQMEAVWLNHSQATAAQLDKIKQQELQEQAFQVDADKLRRQVDDLAAEVEKRESEIATLKSTQSALGVEKDRLNGAIANVRKEVDECREAVTTGETKKRYKTHEMSQAVNLYKERLGLELKRTGDGKLSFVFTKVDRSNPSREFLITVLISNDRYEVVSCTPTVPGLDDLLAELNATNNFAGFIHRVRAAFKSTCS